MQPLSRLLRSKWTTRFEGWLTSQQFICASQYLHCQEPESFSSSAAYASVDRQAWGPSLWHFVLAHRGKLSETHMSHRPASFFISQWTFKPTGYGCTQFSDRRCKIPNAIHFQILAPSLGAGTLAILTQILVLAGASKLRAS